MGITNNINNNKHNHIYKLILLKQNQILNFLDKKIINNKQHLKKKLYFIFIQFISMTFIKYQKNTKFWNQMDFIPHGGYASSKNFILKYFYKKIFENKLIEGAS